MFSFFRKDPNKLLKEATAKKKEGDLEGAIELLKKAYKEISKCDFNYGINPFLRLPLYLQEANRNEEAWQEFNQLLTKGYPNQERNNYPELIPMDNAQVYDKMRLFLQREGTPKLAVKYGLFSYLSRATGLYMQSRREEFKDYISSETIESEVSSLLKKAKKINFSVKISNLIKHEIKNIPKIDFNKLGNMIDEVLQD